MATEPFVSPPRTNPELNDQRIIVDDPEPLEDQQSGPLMTRLIPLFIVLMMVGYFAMIFVTMGSRGAMSPRMMMAPMGMGMMALMYLGVGGHGGGQMTELNGKRKDYFLGLREKRRLAHENCAQVHQLQAKCYPHPATLLSRCGTPTMWTVRPTDAGPAGADTTEAPQAIKPWLTARVGVGLARTWPALKANEDKQLVDEKQEPVTALARRRFLRTQKFVSNCPQGLSLCELPAYGLRGDPKAILALARAMIVSLAFNHSPRDLAIGLVCDDPSRAEWDWLKWLPHTQDRHRRDKSGTARLVWRSLAEFSAESGAPAAAGDPHPRHTVVFIDTPDADAALPGDVSTSATTFVVLRSISESMTELAGRFLVSADHQFSSTRQKNVARADAVTVQQARLIAQKMSRYRPPNWDSGVTETVVDVGQKGFFDAIGVGDIDTFDPRPTWAKNAHDPHFNIPIGFEGDGYTRTNNIVTLDFAEASVMGTGPHGAIQGMTGAGKSYFLNGVVLSLATMFGPDKLNFILMDFKGGATFDGCQDLPHVIANITNLEEEAELIERAADVIEGIIRKRQQLNRQYKVKDSVHYRRLRAKDPDKYPPYPEIFIIVDEFHEFMKAHKEQGYLRLLTSAGAVGRALGIHVLPCSQFIDASLLQDLMKHLTFGISMKTPDGGASRVLLKTTDAAKDLPMGTGAALLRRDVGDPLTAFVSFDVEAPYIAPRSSSRTKTSDMDLSTTTRLHSFALANKFVADGETDTAQPDADKPQDYPSQKDVLIKRIAQFNEVKALELWKPSLRAPITYADIDITPATSPRLEFRLGDTDAPRLHTRLPYTIAPEGGKAHIQVLGKGHSGRTTALEAIVCGAARAYPPQFCSFYCIDYAGGKLGELQNMPNVGAYARKSDTDRVDRLIGETFRLLAIREREFGSRANVTSLDQYFESRKDNPPEDDPYGHFFLVIDGFPSYVDDHDEAKETFVRLLTEGARYGVHLVITAESYQRVHMKMHEHFGTTIHLGVEDPSMSLMLNSRTKSLVRAIPDNQPGRCVDLERELAARIVVPQYEPIQPTGFEGGNPTFDEHADYGHGIARFVESMRQRYPEAEHAPTVDPAPPEIDYSVVWDVYNRYRTTLVSKSIGHTPDRGELDAWWSRQPATDKHLPIGVSIEDLRIVTVVDQVSPHLLAVGDPKSGKTSLLRGLINSIVNTFTPEQAQIVILESKYDLITEQAELNKRGYLLAYAGDKNSAKTAFEAIANEVGARIPSMDQNLTANVIKNRSWYSGPEVFVLIDGAQTFASGGYELNAPITPLIELIEARNDLGLHVYVTGAAQGFPSTRMSNKLYKALAGSNAATLLFSGPIAEGTLWQGTGIKFKPRRPGQAALIDPETMVPEIIQTAHARPWEEH